MNKKKLTNKIYKFYPKNINSILDEDSYITSKEYKKLLKTIQNEINSPSINPHFVEKLNNFSNEIRFDNFTLFDWLDRSYNFHLSYIENNKLIVFHIEISVLIPFFNLYVTINEIDKKGNYIELPKLIRENSNPKILDSYKKLMNLIIENTNLKIFPNELSNIIIDDVSFQDIEFGKFTIYNAYFLNK